MRKRSESGEADNAANDTGEGEMSLPSKLEPSPGQVSLPSKLEPSPAVYSYKDLDAAVAKVERLKASAAAGYWDLGRAVADLHEKQLWKLRTVVDENGKVTANVYKTWDAFCHTELKMTPRSVNSLMATSRNYTKAQVAKWGHSKLDLLLQAPPEQRERLMEKVETGASKRELESEVRKVRDETGFQRAPGGRPRKSKPASAAQTPSQPSTPRPQTLLVPLVPGQVYSSQLFQKPRGRELDWAHREDLHPVNAPTKLNKSRALVDVGFGDVFVEVAIVQTGKAWEILLEAYREAEKES